MPFDSQGNFTRVMNWQEDAANAVPIVASRHDDEDDNFAQGFNECMCRDGSSVATGNFKMGSYKITGLGNGTTTNDAVNYGQLSSAQTTLQGNIDAIETLIKTKIYGVGSIYAETTNTNPSTLLGFGTWSLITSNIVTGVASTAGVRGNGKAIGYTNYNGTYAGQAMNNGSLGQSSFYYDAYGKTLPYTASSTTTQGTATIAGLTTDANNSGITADISSTNTTIYIWQRTA